MQQTQPKDNICSMQVNTVQASDLETHAETRNFSMKNVSECNYLVQERAFYRMSERFVWNITGDIIFSTRLDKINISQLTCRRVPKHRISNFSLNNYFVKERAFYRFNERFVSNMTGDIIFSTRSDRQLRTINHLTSDLPKHMKHRTFPLRKI